MLVDVNAMAICQIDIQSSEAFRILCKTLHMDFVLDVDKEFFVEKNSEDENCIYVKGKNGYHELFDDRGDLFVALRNVAVNIYPNLGFRSDDYIYNQ